MTRFFFTCLLPIWLPCLLFSNEKQYLSNIYNHLIIEDAVSACAEAEMALRQYPNSIHVQEARIKALAAKGDEKELLQAWNNYYRTHGSLQNRDLIECIAWSVLQKGARSEAPLIRLMAVLGSFLSQDAKGIKIILNSLNDTNSAVRGLTVELASHLRDEVIKQKIVSMLRTERNWNVRLELLKAVGVMKIRESKPYLFELISNPKSEAEEKLVATESLVAMYETVSKEELGFLLSAERAGLRLLACKVIAHCELREQSDSLLRLLEDNRAEVRSAALQTLGYLRIPIHNHIERILPLLKDNDASVAISAAWLLLINRYQAQANPIFDYYLRSSLQENRLFAASALAAAGSYGLQKASEHFLSAEDSFVRMNLALGFIGQQYCVSQACDALYEGLERDKRLWSRKKSGIFELLMPAKGGRQSEDSPEEVDQLTRLELLNILAIMNYPKAQAAVASFLKNRNWGISSTTAALLLTEGDEEAVRLVQDLLESDDAKIRVQAAFVLALWGRGEDAIEILERSYERPDWEMREKILESIGRIGAERSIPFLLERLKEPSQSLRIIAAFALLQALYH